MAHEVAYGKELRRLGDIVDAIAEGPGTQANLFQQVGTDMFPVKREGLVGYTERIRPHRGFITFISAQTGCSARFRLRVQIISRSGIPLAAGRMQPGDRYSWCSWDASVWRPYRSAAAWARLMTITSPEGLCRRHMRACNGPPV
jgi:hypothetical protein